MKKLLYALLLCLAITGAAQADTTVYGSYLPLTGGTLSGGLTGPSLTDTGLTASKPVFTDANKKLTSTGTISISDYIYLSVDAGIDGTTAPAAAVVTSSTNKVITRDFSGAADNDLFFTWQPPTDWNGGTVVFRVIGFITNATAPADTETAIFGLSGRSFADSEILSGALGSIVNATFTANATYVQYDRWSTAWSTAVTLTGAAAGETVILNLVRDTDDTYAQTIGVAGLEIKYTRTLAP